jgi:tetratricopeptide (TPR) repeat protein
MHFLNNLHKQLFLILIFISSIISSLYAQSNENADSLIENYFQQLPDDSNKVMELYNKGFAARVLNMSDAFTYANACEESAKNLGKPILIAKANNLLGILNFRSGKLEKAFQYHTKALEIREKLNDKEGIAFSRQNLGNVLSDLNKKQEAETSYLKALQLFNELNNLKQKSITLNNLGILKYEAQQFDAAKKYFTQSLSIGEKLNDHELQAFCYNNIGAIYEAEKNFTEALAYYEDAFELRELMGNEIDIVDSYNNIASVAFEMKDLQKAKSLLFKAKLISEQNEYAEGNLSIYNFLKDVYVQENKFDSAYFYQSLYYKQKEALLTVAEEEEITTHIENNSIEDKTTIDNLKSENYTLKYLIGVLCVFLGMAALLVYKRK